MKKVISKIKGTKSNCRFEFKRLEATGEKANLQKKRVSKLIASNPTGNIGRQYPRGKPENFWFSFGKKGVF